MTSACEAGNDHLFGQSGDDVLYGGDGDDYLIGFTANNEAKQKLDGEESDDHCLPRHRVYHHPHCLAVRHSQCHHRVYHALSHPLEYRP
jgi:hypothetical protein